MRDVPDIPTLVTVRCPALPPAALLTWASWWHRVDAVLEELEPEMTGADLEVIERSACWTDLLELIGRELPHALTNGEPLEPTVLASPEDLADAARVARSRLAWLRASELAFLRPDVETAAVMGALIGAFDAAADTPVSAPA